MKWIDNVLVFADGGLATVLPTGALELRGEGWERRKRKGDNPGTDRARVCRFESERQARDIASRIASIIEAELKGEK